VQGLISQLATAKAALDAAYGTRDPVKIAQAQAKEQALIDQLLQLGASSSTPATTPTPKPTK
jgi:hypothetical protein